MADGDHSAQFQAVLAAAMNLVGDLASLRRTDPSAAVLVARFLRGETDRVLDDGLVTGDLGDAAPDTAAAERPQSAAGGGIRRGNIHAQCLYNGRGILSVVAEVIVLQWLSLHVGTKSTKDGLYGKLSAFCDIGTKGSFSTRLNGMRDAGWLDWPKGLHQQAIKLEAPGRGRLSELIAPGDRGLDDDQYACLAQWAPFLQLRPSRG